MEQLTITRPDDWHVHLRDGDVLQHTVSDIARYFGRGIIMPNLTPPVVNLSKAKAYRERILEALPQGSNFTPLMTLYLTDQTSPEEIAEAKASGYVYAAKLYPSGATTNSDAGVTSIKKIEPTLAAMEEQELPLLVHGEVTDAEIDIFDREKVFLERHLLPLTQKFPKLKVVLEHITTRDSADFVREAPANIGATITAHHLLYNRNQMLVGGIKPHYYCLPILKRGSHQEALIQAATSGSPKFFLGTDSAPHSQHAKESSCGCAGSYTAHCAIELYAEVFEKANALEKLEGFASHAGPDFYGLSRNTDKIVLQKESWELSKNLPFGGDFVIPMRAGEKVHWKVAAFKAL